MTVLVQDLGMPGLLLKSLKQITQFLLLAQDSKVLGFLREEHHED
jgi:hypothetical protein